jgi:hypothetical protein
LSLSPARGGLQHGEGPGASVPTCHQTSLLRNVSQSCNCFVSVALSSTSYHLKRSQSRANAMC